MFIKCEFPTVLEECFQTPIECAIYARSWTGYEQREQSGTVVDTSSLVHTAWDLGSPLNTVAWYFQIAAALAYSRSFSLIALPAAAKVFWCLFFAFVKKEPNQAIMQIKNFIGERRGFNQNGHQHGVTAFSLTLLELEDSGMSAFSCQT